MVFVKVRETYDLHTTKSKMTVIGIHTPKPEIIKRSYPGLLMQCKAYRPVSCDVRLACASMQPLDPLGVGTSEGDVAPEDVFNPILYKAMSNKGMSQLEARINAMGYDPTTSGVDVNGDTAIVDVDSAISQMADDFDVYYGLLSNTHDWKHASPQSGLAMTGLRPLVYEMVYNVGDNFGDQTIDEKFSAIDGNGIMETNGVPVKAIRGSAKEMPFINCTRYSVGVSTKDPSPDPKANTGYRAAGFDNASPYNCEIEVPYLKVMVGCIIVPPSRLHELYYRMVVEWTIEFSQIRQLAEITDWYGLDKIGEYTHYQNYSYESTKQAVTGSSESVLNEDSCMVSATVDVKKVM